MNLNKEEKIARKIIAMEEFFYVRDWRGNIVLFSYLYMSGMVVQEAYNYLNEVERNLLALAAKLNYNLLIKKPKLDHIGHDYIMKLECDGNNFDKKALKQMGVKESKSKSF